MNNILNICANKIDNNNITIIRTKCENKYDFMHNHVYNPVDCKICENCDSLMCRECIILDFSVCVNCVKKNIDDELWCGDCNVKINARICKKCGKFLKHGPSPKKCVKGGIGIPEKYPFSYFWQCDECYIKK